MLAIIILVLTYSQIAFANLYCQSPIQYTCNETAASLLQREDDILRIENDLKNKAFIELQRTDGETLRQLEVNNFQEIDYITPKKLKKKFQKLFFTEVRAQFSNYLKQNKMPNDFGINQLKESFLELIEKENSLPVLRKNEIIKIISTTRLVSLQSEIEESSMEDVMAVYKNCNHNTFEDNAFAWEIKHEKVIVICPGYIIGSIEFLKNKKINSKYSFYPMIMTIGHELGHHFDYEIYPDIYQSLLADVQSQSEHFKSKPENYMSEISADVWGLRLLKNFLKPIERSNLYSKILASAMNDLCDTEDDNIHPTGNYRIDILSKKYLCQ